MPVVKRFSNCRIAIYPRDHRPPHVHVEFRDGSRVKVEIDGLHVSGLVKPASRLDAAMRWIVENRRMLSALWKEIVR